MSLARYLSKLGALLNSSGQVPAAGLASGAAASNVGSGGVTAAMLASGAARSNWGAGGVLQVVQTIKKDTLASTATGWNDVPSLSATITPSNTSNKVLVRVGVCGGGQVSTTHLQIRLLRNGTEIGSGNADGTNTPSLFFLPVNGSGDSQWNGFGEVFDSPASASAVTYKVQFRNNNSSGNIYINRTQSMNGVGNSITSSQLTLQEIAA